MLKILREGVHPALVPAEPLAELIQLPTVHR